jgi:hypothetical protein
MEGRTVSREDSPTEAPNRVAFSPDTISPSAAPDSEPDPEKRQFVSSSSRNRTNLDEVIIETRPYRHAQIFKRPRALQFCTSDESEGGSSTTTKVNSHSSSRDERDSENRSTEDISKQLDRIDLFLDLIWVGIIANISGMLLF